MESTVLELIQKGEFEGVASDLPMDVYHGSPGLSSSGIRKFDKFPALYKYGLDEEDAKETAAQRLGTLLHMKILEPRRFERVTTLIEGHGAKKEVKDAIEAAEKAGLYVYRKREELECVEAMAANILAHPWASRLLTTGETEKSYFARHPEHGFLMKARADAIHEDIQVIADIKTFGDLDDRSLDRQIKKMKYDIRGVHYLHTVSQATGKTFDKFAFVWVSTKPPYPVRVTALGPASTDRAAERLAGIYERYAGCLKTGVWPAFGEDIDELELFFM